MRSIGALAGVAMALGSSAATALDVTADASAGVDVAAHVAVPVNVSSASIGVRPTTLGPVKHDGKVIDTPPIAAGTKVKVAVSVDAEATAGGTVRITTSDPLKAVTLTRSKNAQGQYCFGLGIDFTARVAVRAGASASTATTAKARGTVFVKVGDKTLFSHSTGDLALNNGAPIGPLGYAESFPVVTGADVCLPAEATAAIDASLTAGLNLMGATRLG